MAARSDSTDPRHLTPEQRLDELAALLAKGTGRALALRADAAITRVHGAGPAPPDSIQNLLDVSPQLSVHVPDRLTEVQAGEGVEA
jgi:hypothetical protein